VNRNSSLSLSPGATGGALREPENPCWTSVVQGYERWAPTYDQSPNPLLAREERHLLPLLSGLHDKRILDVACGTGRWLEKLATHTNQLAVGIDCSPAMLNVAGHKVGLRGRLARADGESLPFSAEAFDLAICSFALGHIHQLETLTGELARVTMPGADLFVTDLHPVAYSHGWRVGFRDDSGSVQIELTARPAEEIVEAFYGNGFECLTQVPLWLEEPERPVFARASKSDAFARASQVPAILAHHFRRFDTPKDTRRSQ
jgi:ubiquinone/menaquinone biosynthesis C-methylase UbiE